MRHGDRVIALALVVGVGLGVTGAVAPAAQAQQASNGQYCTLMRHLVEQPDSYVGRALDYIDSNGFLQDMMATRWGDATAEQRSTWLDYTVDHATEIIMAAVALNGTRGQYVPNPNPRGTEGQRAGVVARRGAAAPAIKVGRPSDRQGSHARPRYLASSPKTHSTARIPTRDRGVRLKRLVWPPMGVTCCGASTSVSKGSRGGEPCGVKAYER
jgi:hypothetical protein